MADDRIGKIRADIESTFNDAGYRKASAATKQLEAGHRSATGAVQGFEKAASKTTATLGANFQAVRSLQGGVGTLAGAAGYGGLGAAAIVASSAIGAGLKVVKDGIDDYIRLASETRKYRAVAGGTAEEASRWALSYRALGVDSGSASKALLQLGKRVADAKNPLGELGIEVVKNSAGNTDLNQTLLNVADAYAATEDPAKRDELVFKAFGRAGKDLIPILSQGREKLEALNAEMQRGQLSDADLRRAKEYQLATERETAAWDRLSVSIGRSVVPAFTDLKSALATLPDGLSDTEKKTVSLDKVLKASRDDWTSALPGVGAISFIEKYGHEVTNANAALAQHTDNLKTDAEAGQEAAAAYEEQAAALEHEQSALLASIDSTAGLDRANASLRKAHQETTKAATEAADAIHRGGAKSDEAREASERLTEAQANERDAILSAAHASVQHNKDVTEAAGGTYTAASAAFDFRQRLIELEKQTTGPTKTSIDDYIAQLGGIPDKITTLLEIDERFVSQAGAKERSQEGGGGGYRQLGGPVVPRRVYRWQESGREMFMPTVPGHVFNHRDTERIISALSGGGGGMVNNFYGDVRRDEGDRLGRDAVWAMKSAGLL